ncbi:hypothetical protein ACHAXS_006379 [Conticribra weissflogii]
MLHEPIRLRRQSDSPFSAPASVLSNSINNIEISTDNKNSPFSRGILKRQDNDIDSTHYNNKFFTASPDNFSKPNIRIHPTEMQRYLRSLLRRSSSVADKDSESPKQEAVNQRSAQAKREPGNLRESSDSKAFERGRKETIMTARVASEANEKLTDQENSVTTSQSYRLSIKKPDDVSGSSPKNACFESNDIKDGQFDPFSSSSCFPASSVANNSTGNVLGEGVLNSMPRAVSNTDRGNCDTDSRAIRFMETMREEQMEKSSRTTGSHRESDSGSPLSQRMNSESIDRAPSTSNDRQPSTNSSSPTSNSNEKSSTSNSNNKPNQKNDKPVEVLHKTVIIARFRTQTECAKYLRATPEAVSYHCSKGGGTCNGLTIRPSARDSSGDKCSKSGEDSNNENGNLEFGLFEGATEYRPKVRPQLDPEAVAILKDWLLDPDHVDNPYPNARESDMLLKKTGLEKGQLKHWFNNARKRILKPLLQGETDGAKKRQLLENRRASVDSASNSGIGGGKRRKLNRDSSIITGESAYDGRNESPSTADNHGSGFRSGSMIGTGDSSFICGNGSGTMSSSNNMNGNFNQGNNPFFQGNDTMRSNMMSHDFGVNQVGRSHFRGSPTEIYNQQCNNGNLDEMSSFMMNQNGTAKNNANGNNNFISDSNNRNFDMMFASSSSRSSPGPALCFDASAMNGGRGSNSRAGMSDMVNFNGNNGGFGGSSMDGGFSSNMVGSNIDRFMGFSEQGIMLNDRRFDANAMQFRGVSGRGRGAEMRSSMPTNNDNFTRSGFGAMKEFHDSSINTGDDLPHRDNFDFRRQMPSAQNFMNNPSFSSSHPVFNDEQNESSNSKSINGNGPTSDREHAIFKQQVAAMAMNEATNAFKEMEEAYMHAKEIMVQVSESNKCHSVAMFKLKVSQRANEEAAIAYKRYQGVGGDMNRMMDS